MYQENLFQSRSQKPAFSFICQIILEKYFVKAIEDFFHVSITSLKHLGKLGEFSTVMQTRDRVEGLHNCLEFSHSPSCLDEAMETQKTHHWFAPRKGVSNSRNILYTCWKSGNLVMRKKNNFGGILVNEEI